jgi:CO/xanthine dehydrogenase Mo-binding subunit
MADHGGESAASDKQGRASAAVNAGPAAPRMPPRVFGASPVRVDGWEKVSGAARFIADLEFPGAWIGGTVRSPVPRGTLRGIHLDPAFDWSGVTVVTAANLPGPNEVAMIRRDHPVLAEKEVRFVAEAVALVAAPDRETLDGAMAAIRLEIEELPPVLTMEDALAGSIVISGTDNILADYRVERGDLAAALREADLVVEGEYRTGYQEHLYLETNGLVAIPRAGGAIEITGSMQCPFYIRNALAHGLNLPPERVIVRQVATGGAFGGKEDFPSVLAMHAAVLAQRCGRPVRMIYDRTEDICATTKRHPSIVRHRTGVCRDGSILAGEIDIIFDGGAYTTLSPVVLSRGILHAAGPYRMPVASIRGRAVATNSPPNGAFRGFGVPQTMFAVERQIDRIALMLGLDPLAVRRKNLLRTGDILPFGQVLEEDVGAEAVLERAVEISGYEAWHGEHGRPANADGGADPPLARGERGAWGKSGGSGRRVRRGLGLALFHHGSGFTGAGEERINGRVQIRFHPGPAGDVDGSYEVLVSSTEMGQGAATVLCQIAAEALSAPLSRVSMPLPDTSKVPDSGPTVASRTTMIVGRILVDACHDLVREIAAARAAGEHGPVTGEAVYQPTPGLAWDETAYHGDAYKAYAWGADVVEVEVDEDTLEVNPVRAWAVAEIGRAVNPVLAAGQVEGGTLQGIGWASVEEMKTSRGRFLNDRMATYVVPTALDAPPVTVEILELPHPRGPLGAKGLGELPMDGAAPAFAAAVTDATGLFPCELPITPERLLALQRGRTMGLASTAEST